MKIEEVRWRQSITKPLVDADVAYKELNKIRKSKGLSAESVLEAASSPESILHSFFCWDDSEAARKYRLLQAGNLIRSFEVVYKEMPGRLVRGFEIQSRKPTGSTTRQTYYTTTEEAVADPRNHAKLLARALHDLESWRRRFGNLREFRKLNVVLDEILDSLSEPAKV